MGNLGLEFSEPADYFTKIKNQVRREAQQIALEEKAKKRSTKYTVNEGVQDSVFQRMLVWSSYYVMVFVALCVFNAPARAMVSEAVEIIPVTLPLTLNVVDTNVQVNWKLRTSTD